MADEQQEVGCAFCGGGVPYDDSNPIALGVVERWRPDDERPDQTFYAHRECFASRLLPEMREVFDEPWDDDEDDE